MWVKSLTGIEKTFERVYMDLLLKLMNFFRSHCLFRQRVISNSSLNRSYSLRLQLEKHWMLIGRMLTNVLQPKRSLFLLSPRRRGQAFNSETDNFKLTYGGHQYHASCANFWINCVEPKPPGLILPDLLWFLCCCGTTDLLLNVSFFLIYCSFFFFLLFPPLAFASSAWPVTVLSVLWMFADG